MIITTLTVLAVATLIPALLSYRAPFEKRLDRGAETKWFGVAHGKLYFDRFRHVPNTIVGTSMGQTRKAGDGFSFLGLQAWDCIAGQAGFWGDAPDPQLGEWRRLAPGTWDGTGFRIHLATPRYRISFFALPLWMPLVLFAAYPLVAFVRGPMQHYRRKRRGMCPTCGYDLTGNVSGRCPECGATAEKRHADS